MIIGEKCLVYINGNLFYANVRAIFPHNVIVEIGGESKVIVKENILNSISIEAFNAIEEHQEILVKRDLQGRK